MFWTFSALLFILASLFVLIPIWRNKRNSDSSEEALRKSANISLFHERRNELESELALGRLDQDQFDILLKELQQSLLTDVSNEQSSFDSKSGNRLKSDVSSSNKSISIAIPVFLVLLIPVVAYGLYARWGFLDDVQLMGLFERTVNNADDAEEARALIVELGSIVQQQDDLPWAWYFLAENFSSLGMFTEAEIAYVQSASRMEDSPEKALVLGRIALAKYINADLSITPEVQEIIDQARAINPNENSTLQLLAADAEQRQDYQAAIGYWRLLIQGDPNSQQSQALRESIAAAQALLGEGDEVAVGPAIDVNLSLAEGIELDPDLRIFVAARNSAAQGMPPLAATSLNVGSLPATIRLDNSDAVGSFNLASAETIYISALVSFSGSASPQSGDYRVVSDNITPNGQHAVLSLVIEQQIP